MMKVFQSVAVAALTAGGVVAEILYAGVNSGLSGISIAREPHWRSEAGGEFAPWKLPGVFGADYQFINETAIDFFLHHGVNTIRLPFLLVSVQHKLTRH
jgi:endoglucanase